jgi:hypothetical protein
VVALAMPAAALAALAGLAQAGANRTGRELDPHLHRLTSGSRSLCSSLQVGPVAEVHDFGRLIRCTWRRGVDRRSHHGALPREVLSLVH